MYTVIGLGGVACRVAKNFAEYPQYNVVCVDDQDSDWKHQCKIKPQQRVEDYESNFKGLPQAIKKQIKDDVIFVVCGSSRVASLSLRLLEQVKNKNISIIYIRPETDLLDNSELMQERMIFSVLQEYTRSGLFNEIYLTSNSQMDTLIKDASIKEYYPTMNSMIASVFHMIKVFENQEKVVSNLSTINQARRVCTLGILDMEKNEENLFFPIDMRMDNRLYYGISKDTLDSDKNLQRSIIRYIKDKNTELSKYSYSVNETQYNWDFCYIKTFSSKVQDF